MFPVSRRKRTGTQPKIECRYKAHGRNFMQYKVSHDKLVNADFQLVNALSSFVGQKNTPYSQKTFGTKTISQVLKGKSPPTFLETHLK